MDSDFKKADEFLLLCKPILPELGAYIKSCTSIDSLSDDALQNTLIIAYTKLDKLRDKTKIKNWLFKIGKREAVRLSKKYNKEFYIEDIYKDNPENFVPTDYDIKSTEDQILLKEEQSYVTHLLENLSYKDRQFMKLFYYKELSYKEMSIVLGQKESTLRVIHHRILKKLIKLVESGKNEK